MAVFLEQVAGVSGAFLVLLAYFCLQTGRLAKVSYAYLFFNLFGGLLLLYASIIAKQIGLIVLEGAWATISLYGIIRRFQGKQIEGEK